MLGAVAMVNIPVQDQHPQWRSVPGREALGVARRQRRRVEEAEAARLVHLGVVTRRTDDGGSVSHLHKTKTDEMTKTLKKSFFYIKIMISYSF